MLLFLLSLNESIQLVYITGIKIVTSYLLPNVQVRLGFQFLLFVLVPKALGFFLTPTVISDLVSFGL